jgi:tetratricopeptide (TPR) repeat protein
LVANEVGHARIGRPYGLTMSAFCALQLGQLEKAHHNAQLALDLLNGSAWHNGIGFAKRTFALVLLEQHQLEQALELAIQSVIHNRSIENHFSICSSLTVCARIELAANQPEAALTHLEAAETALKPLQGKRFSALMQAFIENLRGQALFELGRSSLASTLKAVEFRLEHSTLSETSSWLMLSPRETELTSLWRAGQTELAKQELNAFLTLHPDNPRVRILHLRAQAALNALECQHRLAEQRLNSSLSLSLELGFVLQARIATRQLEALNAVIV